MTTPSTPAGDKGCCGKMDDDWFARGGRCEWCPHKPTGDKAFRIAGTGETAGFERIEGWEAWARFCEAKINRQYCEIIGDRLGLIWTIGGRIYREL